MSTPLVSVIIPVYNTPRDLLDRCVQSVLAQTYANLDVLIIDDGSTANIREYCLEFGRIAQRVRVFSQENSGVSSARNLGMNHAYGDYVSFVDSDDVLSEVAIERMVNLIIQEHADVVCSRIAEFGTNSIGRVGEAVEVVTAEVAMLRLLYGEGVSTGPVGKLFSCQILTGQLFDSTLAFAEDLNFNFNVLRSSSRVVIDPSAYYWYDVTSSEGVSRVGFKPARMDGLKSLSLILRDIDPIEDEELFAAANYRLFMECLFILITIKDRSINSLYWRKCIEELKYPRKVSLCNSRVKTSDKLFMIVSMVSVRMTVYLYGLKRRLRLKLRKLKP